MRKEALPSDQQADPDFYALRAAVREAEQLKVTAENALARAGRRLETAAEAVCSTCMNLTRSVEFNYTYCCAIGDVSGQYEHLSSVAKLKDGKFVCSRFKAGGKLKGKP